jgi:hypothetical protein
MSAPADVLARGGRARRRALRRLARARFAPSRRRGGSPPRPVSGAGLPGLYPAPTGGQPARCWLCPPDAIRNTNEGGST